jgi:PAS domain S-box-containing protein
MFEDVLLSLLRNAILLFSLGALYDILPSKPEFINKKIPRILTGFLLGLIAITVMSSPWTFALGITFDTRSILLSLSGLFFSPLSAIIATFLACLMRIYQGGAGTVMGLGVILTSAGAGIVWQRFRWRTKKNYSWKELYIFGIVIHINMLLWIFSLPQPSRLEVLRHISLPVMLIYPIGTVLLGKLLNNKINRKEINQKIQENEETLRQVIQNMPVMLDAFDENNNIIVWNKESERVTGYKAEEIINNPDALAMLYPDLEQRQRITQEYAGPQIDFTDVEFTLTAKDGSQKTISWSSSYNGISIPGWHYWAIGVDVTAQINALKALKNSEAQYRRMIETTEEGIWMIDAENKTVFVNQKTADLLGYSIEEMTNSEVFNFISEQRVDNPKNTLTRRLPEISGQHDVLFKHKDGRDIWTLLSTSPVIDDNGQYAGALAMISDISDRKQMEKELQLYKERLQIAQEIGQVGSWEYDLNTGKIWGSDEGFHIYGLTPPPDNALPADIIETFIPEREMVHQALVDLINEEKPYNLEFELRPPHGRYTIITSMAELIKDEQGNPIKVSGVIQDITKRKLAEMKVQQLNAELEQKVEERTSQLQTANEELQKAMRARDTFLANMSHELRTPLTAILGMSEILEEQIRGPLNEKQLHFVKSINSSGEHLLQLINDVLDLSKIEASNIKLDIHKLVFEELCEASLAFIRNQAEDKHLQIQFSQKTRQPVFEADGRRLKQILINLLNNAVKFTPENGEIGLEVKDDPEDDRFVQFIVWDTGIGITAENQKILFQPFVQVDSNLNRSYEGTGLGLVLVSRFTELHNGEVTLESEPGQGTRVTVRLPYQQEK